MYMSKNLNEGFGKGCQRRSMKDSAPQPTQTLKARAMKETKQNFLGAVQDGRFNGCASVLLQKELAQN